MSIPTHSINCYTKAYQTTCQDCNQSIWFFSCTCGSKVFFDDLGSPWTIHICQNLKIKEAIELMFQRFNFQCY